MFVSLFYYIYIYIYIYITFINFSSHSIISAFGTVCRIACIGKIAKRQMLFAVETAPSWSQIAWLQHSPDAIGYDWSWRASDPKWFFFWSKSPWACTLGPCCSQHFQPTADIFALRPQNCRRRDRPAEWTVARTSPDKTGSTDPGPKWQSIRFWKVQFWDQTYPNFILIISRKFKLCVSPKQPITSHA